MARFVLLAVMAVVLSAPVAAETVNLDGACVLEVPSGTVTNISDRITGDGYFVVLGGGTVVFSGAGNDFTGGIIVSNGVVRADASGAFGTGDVILDGPVVNKTVILNSALGVFENSIILMSGTTSASKPALKIEKNATLNGDVVAENNVESGTAYFYVSVAEGITANFNGSVEASETYVRCAGKGKFHFKGAVNAYRLMCGEKFDDKGCVYLYNPENRIARLYVYAFHVCCRAKNVLYRSWIFFDWNEGWGANGGGLLFVGGFDQEFAIVYNRSFPKALRPGDYSSAVPIETSHDAESVITIVGESGGDVSGACYSSFGGRFSIVVDKLDDGLNLYQKFLYRESKMTGNITVKNGAAYIGQGATFLNVPKVTVTGGTLVFTAATNAMPSVVELNLTGGETRFDGSCVNTFPNEKVDCHLTSGAKMYLASGVTNTVRNLYVDGVKMPSGMYSYENFPAMKYSKESDVAKWTGVLKVKKGPKFFFVVR